MITQGLQPYVNTTDDPPIYFLGLPTILRATGQTTNGAFGLVENLMPPGFASPYHTHQLEDEAGPQIGWSTSPGMVAFRRNRDRVCAGSESVRGRVAISSAAPAKWVGWPDNS